MARLRLHRRTAIRVGMLLVAVSFVGALIGSAIANATQSDPLAFYAVGGTIGFSGLILLLVSPFLPQPRGDEYRGMGDLLSQEKVHYGNYAVGNWRTTLDEMDKEDKEKRKRETDHQ